MVCVRDEDMEMARHLSDLSTENWVDWEAILSNPKYSDVVGGAFRAKGHDVTSVDLDAQTIMGVCAIAQVTLIAGVTALTHHMWLICWAALTGW